MNTICPLCGCCSLDGERRTEHHEEAAQAPSVVASWTCRECQAIVTATRGHVPTYPGPLGSPVLADATREVRSSHSGKWPAVYFEDDDVLDGPY